MENFYSDLEKLSIEREKRHRLRIVLLVAPNILSIGIWFWTSEIGWRYFDSEIPRMAAVLLFILTFSFSAIILIMIYLQTGFKKEQYLIADLYGESGVLEENDLGGAKKTSSEAELLRADLIKARKEMDRLLSLSSSIKEEDKSALINDLKDKIKSVTAESVLLEIKEQVKEMYALDAKEQKDRELLNFFESSKERMSKELSALGRRGNLNLALGAVTTVIGLWLLGSSVLQENDVASDLWSMASHFLPRLTLVIMIELFAYFFLKLYKSSLQEIKYLQNELTNIESRQISLRAALNLNDPSTIMSVIKSLSETERNHILSKDQTTVELERARIDRESRSDIAKYFSEIVQKKG